MSSLAESDEVYVRLYRAGAHGFHANFRELMIQVAGCGESFVAVFSAWRALYIRAERAIAAGGLDDDAIRALGESAYADIAKRLQLYDDVRAWTARIDARLKRPDHVALLEAAEEACSARMGPLPLDHTGRALESLSSYVEGKKGESAGEIGDQSETLAPMTAETLPIQETAARLGTSASVEQAPPVVVVGRRTSSRPPAPRPPLPRRRQQMDWDDVTKNIPAVANFLMCHPEQEN